MAATRSGSYPEAPGLLLTVNIENFLEELKDPRIGAHHDDQSLKDVFELLQFKVVQERDCTKKQFKRCVRSAMWSLDGLDGPFFLCIMSHGDENGVMFADGKMMSVEDIRRLFAKDSCKRLERRPKVVIIQACRGSKMLTARSDGTTQMVNYTPDFNPSRPGQPVDRWADTLVFRSCVEDRLSFLSPDVGSRFITILCTHILTDLGLKGRCDMMKIATSVTKEMSENLLDFDDKRVFGTPEVTGSTLTKHLFLSLPEPDSTDSKKLLTSALRRIVQLRKVHVNVPVNNLKADGAAGCRCATSGCGPNTKCSCQRGGRPCTPSCRCLQVEDVKCTNAAGTERPPAAPPVASSAGCRCINSGCKPNTKCACQRLQRSCTPACRCLQVEDVKCTNEGRTSPTPHATAASTAASTVAAASSAVRCRCINSGCRPNTKCRCQREGTLCVPGCHQVENAVCFNKSLCQDLASVLTAEGGARRRPRPDVAAPPVAAPAPPVIAPATARLRTPARGCCRCINSKCGPNTKCRCRRERKPCSPGCHQVEDAECSNTAAAAACACTTKCLTASCSCRAADRLCDDACHPQVCSNRGDINSGSTSDESSSDVEVVSSDSDSEGQLCGILTKMKLPGK